MFRVSLFFAWRCVRLGSYVYILESSHDLCYINDLNRVTCEMNLLGIAFFSGTFAWHETFLIEMEKWKLRIHFHHTYIAEWCLLTKIKNEMTLGRGHTLFFGFPFGGVNASGRLLPCRSLTSLHLLLHRCFRVLSELQFHFPLKWVSTNGFR